MNKKTKFYSLEFFVGLFFVLALMFLLYFTGVVSGQDFLLGKGRYKTKVKFPSVDVLGKSDKVYYLGMLMGTVRDFKPDKTSENVIVTLGLDKELVFHEDYVVEIRNTSLLGGKYVHINTGSLSKPAIPKGVILNGNPPFDIMRETASLIGALKSDEKLFREEILQGKMVENIKGAAAAFQEITDSVKEGNGTLGKMINDPSLYDDVKVMVEKISSASKQITEILESAQSGKGTFGKMLTDDAVYEKLKAALENFQPAETSSFGKVMKDDGKLYESFNSAVESLDKVASMLAEGKGTIGKLLTDDKLYDEMKEAVYQLRGAVEDFREQAPIATFGSMVLGAL